VFVVEKQLVIHLQTRHENTDIGFMMVEGGGPDCGTRQEDRGQVRASQSEAKVWGEAYP